MSAIVQSTSHVIETKNLRNVATRALWRDGFPLSKTVFATIAAADAPELVARLGLDPDELYMDGPNRTPTVILGEAKLTMQMARDKVTIREVYGPHERFPVREAKRLTLEIAAKQRREEARRAGAIDSTLDRLRTVEKKLGIEPRE